MQIIYVACPAHPSEYLTSDVCMRIHTKAMGTLNEEPSSKWHARRKYE